MRGRACRSTCERCRELHCVCMCTCRCVCVCVRGWVGEDTLSIPGNIRTNIAASAPAGLTTTRMFGIKMARARVTTNQIKPRIRSLVPSQRFSLSCHTTPHSLFLRPSADTNFFNILSMAVLHRMNRQDNVTNEHMGAINTPSPWSYTVDATNGISWDFQRILLKAVNTWCWKT